MRIAISGVHGTGKTTLIEALKKEEVFKDYTFYQNLTRDLKKITPINEKGTSLTQVLVINKHVERLVEENTILDRSILDGFAYTGYLYSKRKVELWIYEYASEVFDMLNSKYDVIFYVRPEFDLQSDGTRSDSLEFRDEVLEWFERIIMTMDKDVVYITGGLEQRKNQILEWVKSENSDI